MSFIIQVKIFKQFRLQISLSRIFRTIMKKWGFIESLFFQSIIFSYIRHSLLKSSFCFTSAHILFPATNGCHFMIIFINSNTAHLHIQKTKYSAGLKHAYKALPLICRFILKISHSFIHLVNHSFIQKYFLDAYYIPGH